MKELEEKCHGTVEHFRKELSKMRTGRASTGMLESVQVDYYGGHVPLVQLGLINVPEPRLITIQVYDPQAVESVEKAIMLADLGFNPSREGALIRINVPPLTQDRRNELVKRLRRMGEDVKVALRGHRRDAVDAVKKSEKSKEISEDIGRRQQEDIQKVIDKHIAEIDVLVSAKEKELMEI